MINDPYSNRVQSPSTGCCYWFTTSSLNAVAALTHAIQAVVVLALSSWINSQDVSDIGKGIFSLQKTVSIWHKRLPGQKIPASQSVMTTEDYYVEYSNIDAGELDVRYIIVAFFTLSAFFQAIGGYILGGLWGRQLRYIEYSISASIMILAIGVESGIRDIYILEMMFTLTWITMILGLLADHMTEFFMFVGGGSSQPLFDPLTNTFGYWTWVIPHFAGWATCLAAYGPILDHFITSSSKSDISAPGFVNVIVFLQFTFFSCFGFVQLYYLINKTYILQGGGGRQQNLYGANGMDLQSSMGLMYNSDGTDNGVAGILNGDFFKNNNNVDIVSLVSITENAERMYIILSLSAKTILSWLIISPIITSIVK
jgi:hypothetical protein